MSGLYLLEVNVLPSAYVKDVVHRSLVAIRTGTATGNGKVLGLYKIVGESKIVSVVDGGIPAAEEQLNNVSGDMITTTCSPLRSYETFARNELGVDTRMCSPKSGDLATEGRQLYWLQISLNHQGYSTEEFLAHWKEDANFVLCERMLGRRDLSVYKVIAERKVHMFISVPDGETLDSDVFSLPIVKAMGNNVEIVCKALMAQ